jgi:hypothetical protein
VPSADENWQDLNFTFNQDKVLGNSNDNPPGGIVGFPNPDPEGIVTDSTGMTYQEGDRNKAAILQVTGSYHYGEIHQLVGDNEARILQAGFSQYADIDQEGANNGADVRQQGDGPDGNHYAKVLQTGDWNTALIDQNGEGNEADVEQQGDYDVVEISQSGNDNDAHVLQEDDSVISYAIVNQTGGENISVINQ